jgi:hypothetical protein
LIERLLGMYKKIKKLELRARYRLGDPYWCWTDNHSRKPDTMRYTHLLFDTTPHLQFLRDLRHLPFSNYQRLNRYI